MKPFSGPRLKVERAKQHISDLQTELVTFANSDFYSLRVEQDRETADCFLKFEVRKSIPDSIALVIGDVLHNLKSALDFTVNDVVFSRTRKHSPYTRFPIRSTRDELVAAVTGGTIHQASKAVADFIVDTVKPYKGGNDALWALHDLNILDKHMLLLPMVQVNTLIDVSAEADGGKRMTDATLVLGPNRRAIIPFFKTKNIKITNHGKPILTVLFDKGLPLQGKPVVPTLKQLTELVTGVIEGLEQVFLAESAIGD